MSISQLLIIAALAFLVGQLKKGRSLALLGSARSESTGCNPQSVITLALAPNSRSEIASSVSVLIVNEPIFAVAEEKSPVRYNAVYPRWVYDQYRVHIATQVSGAGWNYLDLWHAVPPEYFVDAHFSLLWRASSC